jgi:molybdenum-dependent DNA-binding transcriptional regulator ModE
MGRLIQDDPERASKRLTELIAQHGSQVKAARALGVPPRTIVRWISKVASLNFPIGIPSKKTS